MAKSLKILHPGLNPRLALASSPLGVVVLAPGRLRVQERQAPDREGRRGEERGDDDDAKAKHDAPARERSISGSGDDAAKRLRLWDAVPVSRGTGRTRREGGQA